MGNIKKLYMERYLLFVIVLFAHNRCTLDQKNEEIASEIIDGEEIGTFTSDSSALSNYYTQNAHEITYSWESSLFEETQSGEVREHLAQEELGRADGIARVRLYSEHFNELVEQGPELMRIKLDDAWFIVLNERIQNESVSETVEGEHGTWTTIRTTILADDCVTVSLIFTPPAGHFLSSREDRRTYCGGRGLIELEQTHLYRSGQRRIQLQASE